MATQSKRRVPDAKAPFNAYITGSTTHLETGTTPNRRGEVLGLSTAELDDWIAWRDDWEPLFAKYNDPSQRTTTVTKDVNDLMADFRLFAEPLLTRMSGSAALDNTDRDILHLPERDKTPTARGKIDTSPMVSIKGLGGGQLKFRVRIDEDASRASMHPLADYVEIKYVIQGEEPTGEPGPPEGGGGSDFPSVEKATNYTISKKAMFVLDAGQTHTGKFIIAFVRWANASNPANSGPWSLPVIGLIS